MTRPITTDELIEAAGQARDCARADFSGFRVGCALETASGKVVSGCNIENATLGLTICAERVAVFKALSEGEREFSRLCVLTSAQDPAPPCGACRQILWEFCGDIPIVLAGTDGQRRRTTTAELLPEPFDGSFL